MKAHEPLGGDMLRDTERKKVDQRLERWEYSLCLTIWIVSIAALPLVAFFNGAASYYTMGMFVLILVSGAITGFFTRKNDRPFAVGGGFDAVVFAAFIAGLTFFAVFLLITSYYGGAPKESGGEYLIISHNQRIRSITEKEYRVLSVIHALGPAALDLSFTSGIMLKARRLGVK